jgi:hypothetical protein
VNGEPRRAGVNQAEVIVAPVADPFDLVPQVVLADRRDDVVERQEHALLRERGAGDRLAVRELGRRAGGERGHDLALEIGPGERLGLDLDSRVFGLEAPRG